MSRKIRASRLAIVAIGAAVATCITNSTRSLEEQPGPAAPTPEPPLPQAIDGGIADFGLACRAKVGNLTTLRFSCLNGSIIPINRDAGDPEADCDRPPWLGIGSGTQCKPFARLLKLNTTDNDTDIRVICRRYFIVPDAGEPLFEDVAMVVHKKQTGETCYFQALSAFQDGGAKLNGAAVPSPMADPGAAGEEGVVGREAQVFWIAPQVVKESSGLKCVKCHDNDPWMHTPYIDEVTGANQVPSGKRAKYKLVEEAFWTTTVDGGSVWPIPFAINTAKVKDGNDQVRSQRCTDCHRIADLVTCNTWLGNSVYDPPVSNLSPWAKQLPQSHWMPLDHGETTDAGYAKAYANHLKAMRCCCENPTRLGCSKTRILNAEGSDNPVFGDGGSGKCVDDTGQVALNVRVDPTAVASRNPEDTSCSTPLDQPLCASFSVTRVYSDGGTTLITRGLRGFPLGFCNLPPDSDGGVLLFDPSLDVLPGDRVQIHALAPYGFAEDHQLLQFSGWAAGPQCPCQSSGPDCLFQTKGASDWFGFDEDHPDASYPGDPPAFNCLAQYQPVGECTCGGP